MIARRFAVNYGNGNGWYGNQNGAYADGMFTARPRGRPFEAEDIMERAQKRPDGRVRGRGVERRSSEFKSPKSDPDKGKIDKSFKWLGLALAITSSASISIGISNIAVTASTVLTADNGTGCFLQSQWYDQLGPKTDTMRSLDWSWVTVGLWSSLLTYLAGMIVGKINKKSSTLRKILMFAGLVSLIAMLPVRLILSVLDSLLSSGCQSTNTAKFALPVSLAVVAVVEFILLLVVLLRLRRQVKKWEEPERPVSKRQSRRYNARPALSQMRSNQPAEYRVPQTGFPLFQPMPLRPMYGMGVARRWAPQVPHHYGPYFFRP